MSRASKHLAKEKARAKKAMGNITINCPKCGIPIPQEVFLKGDMGRNYKCAVCGCDCFDEWVKGLYK